MSANCIQAAAVMVHIFLKDEKSLIVWSILLSLFLYIFFLDTVCETVDPLYFFVVAERMAPWYNSIQREQFSDVDVFFCMCTDASYWKFIWLFFSSTHHHRSSASCTGGYDWSPPLSSLCCQWQPPSNHYLA